jgi:hypothetical protein
VAHVGIGATAAGSVIAGTLLANFGRTAGTQQFGRVLAGVSVGVFGLASVLGDRLHGPRTLG